MVGRKTSVLIDGTAPKGEAQGSKLLLQGRTATDKVVLLVGDEELLGRTVTAEITEAGSWYLKGVIVV